MVELTIEDSKVACYNNDVFTKLLFSSDAMLSEEDDTEMGDHHESSPVPIHTRSSSTKQHFASSHRISRLIFLLCIPNCPLF